MLESNRRRRRFQYHATHHSSAIAFFNALTRPGLLDFLDARLPAHRERLFPPTETLSMFLAQALSADGSCRWAVDQAATYGLLSGLPLCSTATGGYCRARARLPVALIQQLTHFTAAQVEAQTPHAWRESGRRVRVVDGTTLSLADTLANQARYPQSRTQKPGLGFPICRLVAAFELADGALVDAAVGGYRGKGAHDRPCCANCSTVSHPTISCSAMRCFVLIFSWPNSANGASMPCSSNTARVDARLISGEVNAWAPVIIW